MTNFSTNVSLVSPFPEFPNYCRKCNQITVLGKIPLYPDWHHLFSVVICIPSFVLTSNVNLTFHIYMVKFVCQFLNSIIAYAMSLAC